LVWWSIISRSVERYCAEAVKPAIGGINP
jgi:hypothetical protein